LTNSMKLEEKRQVAMELQLKQLKSDFSNILQEQKTHTDEIGVLSLSLKKLAEERKEIQVRG